MVPAESFGRIKTSQLPADEMFLTSKNHSTNYSSVSNENMQTIFSDPVGDVDGEFDLNKIQFELKGRDYVFAITTHSSPFSFNSMRVNIFYDTDMDATTGALIGGMGVDAMVAIGNFGNGYGAYVLEYNANLQDLQFVGMSKTFDANKSARKIEFSQARGTFNNSKQFGMYVQAFRLGNIIKTLDYAPDYNQGYLVVKTDDLDFLEIKNNSGFISNDAASTIELNISAKMLPEGLTDEGLTLVGMTADGMVSKYIPLTMDNITNVNDEISALPKQFALEQNYPNPFNPSTVIEYSIGQEARGDRQEQAVGSEQVPTTLIVYNILGSAVATLVNENKSPGKYSVSFEAKNLASGLYFYELKAGSFKSVKKMVLLK